MYIIFFCFSYNLSIIVHNVVDDAVIVHTTDLVFPSEYINFYDATESLIQVGVIVDNCAQSIIHVPYISAIV